MLTLVKELKAETDTNPLVDVILQIDSSEDETAMEKVESVSDDDSNVIDTTLDEAEDSSDVDESTEARASELLSTAKDNLRDVEMESLGDKPEGEEDRSGLGHVPMITIPSIQQPTGVPEFNHSQDTSETQDDVIQLLDGSGRHVRFLITGI